MVKFYSYGYYRTLVRNPIVEVEPDDHARGRVDTRSGQNVPEGKKTYAVNISETKQSRARINTRRK